MSFIKNIFFIGIWSLLTVFCVVVVLCSSLYLYLSPGLPDVNALKNVKLQIPLRIFSGDGKMIGEFGEKRRDPISITETPQNMINAVLAAEDDRFYQHSGISIRSLARAASQLMISGEIQSGGSTITMQVARNFFLSRTQTFYRKFNEILLALKIEQKLTKDEVLELYLNKIYLGNRAYGFKAASQVYYGKPLDELTLAQTAMIAGLPKAPSTFNPIVNPERALIRRDWILSRMLSLQFISGADYEKSIREPVSARYHGQRLDLNAPYIAEMARLEAINLFGVNAYTDGYQVVTTIDSRLQEKAQQTIIDGLLAYSSRHGYYGPEKKLDSSLLKLPVPGKANDNVNDNIPVIQQLSSSARAIVKSISSVESSPTTWDFSVWADEIKKIPVYGGLQPAVVIAAEDKQIHAMLGSGKSISIYWENGLSNARPYIDENTQGPKPRKASDILSLGDVIRVRNDPLGAWHLGQIPRVEGAMVALNPQNGAIRSLIGGFDFNQSSFNRATQAKRQLGSNFKPFIYTLALENNLTPASIINDAPIVIDDFGLEGAWRPQNSSGKFYGPTRLREALYLSRNLISIRLLQHIGIDKAIASMARFGIDPDQLPRNLSMALGSHVMTPLEVAAGYSVFANGGYKIQPFLIDIIRSHQGEIVYSHIPEVALPHKQQSDGEVSAVDNHSLLLAPRVIDEHTAYIMNSMLKDVIARGTGRRALVLDRRDLAGKTGTTNGPTDAWFSGYNPDLVTTVWVGFDGNKNLGRREYGGSAALPIWIDYMEAALNEVPDILPSPPDGIITIRIDPETGERALPGSKNGIFEIFRKENVPSNTVSRKKSVTDIGEERATPEDIWIN